MRDTFRPAYLNQTMERAALAQLFPSARKRSDPSFRLSSHSAAPDGQVAWALPDQPVSVAKYPDVAKTVRNMLRRFSAESIVQTGLERMRTFHARSTDEELRSAPWLCLLAIKLILEDKQIHVSLGEPCTAEALRSAIQRLWDADRPMAHSATMFLRSMFAPQQLPFQQRTDFSFVRWPALVASLPADHPSKMQFCSELGMTPQAFVALGWSIYATLLDGKHCLAPGYFSPLKRLHGEATKQFVNLFSRSIVELRAELRKELDARLDAPESTLAVREQVELMEFPWLSRYPLLRQQDGSLQIWHPRVFAVALETAAHRVLSELKQAYTDPFSKVFEAHIVGLMKQTRLCVVDESQWAQQVGKAVAKVEGIVPLATANLLVEAKMSIFPDALLTTDRPEVLFTKLERVREAIVQAWRVGDLLRAGLASVGGRRVGEDFLMVVTSRQLNVCSGEMLLRLLKPDATKVFCRSKGFSKPSEEQLQQLPWKNIFIVSVKEFEQFIGGVLHSEINDVEEFLRRAAERQQDPRTASFSFEQILARAGVKQPYTPNAQASLIDEVQHQLEQLLPPQ